MLAARITAFLREIGIPVEAASLAHGETFLPGIRLERGALLVDDAKLAYPGDLLHEAGHVAMTPPELRSHLSGDVEVPGPCSKGVLVPIYRGLLREDGEGQSHQLEVDVTPPKPRVAVAKAAAACASTARQCP